MAKVRIIPEDGVVGVDGEFRAITIVGLDPAIHAVQWDEDSGFVEYNDERGVEKLTELGEFQRYVDVWAINAPAEEAPLTGTDVITAEVAEIYAVAVAAVEAERIAALVADSLLPEAVAYQKAKVKLDKLL